MPKDYRPEAVLDRVLEKAMPKDYQEIEEIARTVSQSVRMYCGKGQYDAWPDCQDAYLDGVETAIGMMYLDLTGTPKSQGVLTTYGNARELEGVEKERMRIWSEIVELADDYTGELITHLDDIDKITRPALDQYKCQSYYEDGEIIDCTCGKCKVKS